MKYAIVALALLLGCEGDSQAGPDKDKTRVYHFVTLSVKDSPQMIGGEAMRMLIPAGWKSEGGVVWRQHPVYPATMRLRVFNPNGPEEFDMLPNMLFVWSDRGIAFFPPGSNYLGNEVARPIPDPIEAIKKVVLPRYATKLPQYRIVASEELPKLGEAATAQWQQQSGGLPTNVRAGKVRLEYHENGKDIQQDVYCTVPVIQAPAMATVYWGIDTIVAFKAEKGQLDNDQKILETMAFSPRLNLEWYNKYSQVVAMLIQAQKDASDRNVQLSQYIARTNSQITDDIRRSYELRQQTLDKVNNSFDQYIRGVQTFTNPADHTQVELPSGYDHAWVNGQGEYVVTDSGNFNPNVDLKTGNWQKLDKK